MARLEPTCGSMSGWAIFSTSARRVEASSCNPGSGPWYCSAPGSERRLSWQCCTRWRRPTRHGRSCGCMRLATGSIIHLPQKSAASCPPSPMAAAMFVTAGRARRTRWARISTPPVTYRDRSSMRSASRERRMSTSAARLAMADMKEALAAMDVAPERIHVEIFNGSEPMTPGVVGTVARAPHLPEDDANTGPLVSFARSGIAAHWKASAYQSILELAEACDVPVRWSCRTGVCHNCESGLVSGEVAYEPQPLEQPADGNLLVCCSQPIRDVVIDL